MGPLIYAMTVDFHMKDEKETMDQVTHKSLCWSCYTDDIPRFVSMGYRRFKGIWTT
jgi:hypothetical protein